MRLTAGGDQLDYPRDLSSPTVSLLDVKLHPNSVISDANHGARYMCADIRDFYLGASMEYYQYMKVHRRHLPEEILREYDIPFGSLGNTFVEIRRGIYGLKEVGALAHKQLVENLRTFGYEPAKSTPGLWRHHTRALTFTLCVDDLGIKYYRKEDTIHLLEALNKKYETTVDWKGSKYCGLTIKWEYQNGDVDISMPDYVYNALTRF